jgi:hypothetical protein
LQLPIAFYEAAINYSHERLSLANNVVAMEMTADYALVGHIEAVQVYRRIVSVRPEASAQELPGSMSVHSCGE